MEAGGTLQEWGGRRTVMEALPAMDCYEDMFKEITRKLYGEDGLQEMEEHGIGRPSDCDGDSPEGHGALAAFGLAALMQNGFPPPPGMFSHHHHLPEPSKSRSSEDKWVTSEESLQWTNSKIATYNAAQRLFRCTECECVGFLSRVAEHWLGTHANLRVFQCPSCPYASAWARCVRMHLQRQHNVADNADNLTGLWKENPVLEEVTKYLQRLKNRVESQTSPLTKTEYVPNNQSQHPSPPARAPAQLTGSENTPSKRYCCTYCPYATDRRDLFTRHENIHRDEKPFQCYVCQKQFNRADHVKKHFLRMHRDHPYDLNRIRRPATKPSNGVPYYDKYPAPVPQRPQTLTPQGQLHHGLNIPAGFPPPAAMRGLKTTLPSPKIHQNGCNAKSHGSKSSKKRGEKRYSCCYCAWSGVDNWCLKRHLNTHLKPFICALCDYKAARSERLATHVLKVHNKRACGRCSFLGEDSAQLAIHVQEHHPLEHRNSNRPPANVLRAANIPNNHVPPAFPTAFCSHDTTPSSPARRPFEDSSGLWTPHGHLPSSYPISEETWKTSKHFGAARLFQYMEASDTSEPENEPEEEPPPFICRECGCEFVDDTSLETHVFMHHRTIKQESTRPIDKYAKCEQLECCGRVSAWMNACIVCHSFRSKSRGKCRTKKPLRKQGRPERSSEEILVIRRIRGRKKLVVSPLAKLRDKYISMLIMRRGRRCSWCRTKQIDFPFHSIGSLTLHQIWRHRPDRFGCEHCTARFRHRYQVVLHASRDHLPLNDQAPTVFVADQENSYTLMRSDQTFSNSIPSFVSLHELQPGFKSHFMFSTRTLQELSSNKPYQVMMKGNTEDEEKIKHSEVSATYKVVEFPNSVQTHVIEAPTYIDPPPAVVAAYPPSA